VKNPGEILRFAQNDKAVVRLQGSPVNSYENIKRNREVTSMPRKRTLKEERELNQRAFLRLRRKMAETHPGQWIGLVEGKVVATAPTLEALESELDKIERCPARRLAFRAGDPYPLTKARLPILPLRW
jgi:hypothetical protein